MPIPTTPPVIVLPPAPVIVGAYAFQLERSDGSVYVLNGSVGIEPQLGAQGLDGPTLDIAEYTPAGWDGSIATQVSAETREVFLPLLLSADTLLNLRDLKHSLLAFLNPYLGQVTLRATLPDGRSRLIDGIYRSGIDGVMDGDSWWVKRQKVGVVLRCGQPFWRSGTDWTVEWKQTTDAAALLPILPLAPDNSNALGASNPITVDGDVPTYPVWSITGPLESVTIQDTGAGQSFTLTASIGAGETWVVDTRRGRQAVYDDTGARQRSALNAGAQLFPLRPGVTVIETTITGASAGASVRGVAPVLWLAA